LRQRLEQRGITLSAGLLAAIAVPAGVSAEWVRRVIETSPSPAVSSAARAAVGSGLRIAPTVSLAAVAMTLVAGTVLLDAAGDPPPKPAEEKRAEPEPVKRVDAFGDPLPAGAIARLGTLRFNHGGDGSADVRYSTDGKWVLSSGGGNARVWDVVTGKELRHFTTGKPVYGDRAGLTADGRVLLPEDVGGRETIHVWDVETGTELNSVKLPWAGNKWGQGTRFSPGGKLAARLNHDTVPVCDLGDGRLLYTLKPDGGAKAVTFAGDGLLVTVDGRQQVQTWEAATGKAVRQFDHGGPAVVLAASADGRVLATLEHHTGAIDKYLDKDVLHVWDLSSGQRKRTLTSKPQRWFMGVGLSPDGKRLAAVAWGEPVPELLVWDTNSGELIHELSGVYGNILGFRPDGRRLLLGLPWGRFEELDLTTDRPLKLSDARFAVAAAVGLSPDGSRASVTGYDSVSTWDASTGRRLTAHDLPPFGSMNPIRRYSPDGRYAVTYEGDYSRGRMVIREAATGKAAVVIDPGITEAGFSLDSSLIATRHWDAAAKASTIQVREIRTGKVVHTVRRTRTDPFARSLFLADDGDTLIATGAWVIGYSLKDDRELFAWRMAHARVHDPMGREVRDQNGKRIDEDAWAPWRVLTVSPDGSMVAGLREFEGFGSLTLPERLVICDARTGRVLHRCSDGGRGGTNWGAIKFSADNRLLASSDGQAFHLWEAATGMRIRTFAGHRGEIADLAFSANGRRLASAGYDSTVLIWDLSAPAKGDPAEWWADLAIADAAAAYAAVWRIADAADDVALPLLRKRLRPVTAADAERVGRLIGELDSDQFRTRDRAFKELADLGHAARPAVRAALTKKPSAESASRLEQLLSKLVGPPGAGESLRTWRALAALEAKGTPGAVALLKELAAGADGWLTDESKAALRRVSGR
jgi:WD40 repeat protein